MAQAMSEHPPVTGRRFPRLEAIFGVPVSQLDAEVIHQAVEDGVSENNQLDWKQEHAKRTVEGRAELAKDVCALANHQGGALIYGVADNAGTASKAMPVDVSDEQQRHIRSVLASNTAPMPRVDLVTIEEDDGVGYLAIVVAPSPNAPHAVSVPGTPSLTYPVRHGIQTRYLSEPELAESYGRRLEAITSRQDRLGTLLEDGGKKLAAGLWTVLALTPETAGQMELGYVRLRELSDWIARVEQPSLQGNQQIFRAYQGGAALRRATFRADQDVGNRATGCFLELHSDGSSFLAIEEGGIHKPVWGESDEGEWTIYNEALVENATAMLELACRHATENAGTWGDALATFTVIAAGPPLSMSRHSIVLAHGRGARQRTPMGRTEEVPSWMPHTVILEAGLSGPGRLATVRLLTTDVVQSFGVPELLQIDPAGRLRGNYFMAGTRNHLEAWAERNGAQVVDEDI